MSQVRDIAIIGVGPAGAAAAIYLKRFGFNPICYEYQMIGGKINFTNIIDNYPGFQGEGQNLAANIAKQIEEYDIAVIPSEVKVIRKKDDFFEVETANGKELYNVVIIATGMTEKAYEVPGSTKYKSRAISRCAICDGPLFRQKEVVVLGGGNSAFEEATYLASICSHVTLINRRSEFRADSKLVQEFKSLSNVEIKTPYVIKDSDGENKIESLTLENVEDKTTETIKADALFIYIGAIPMTSLLEELDALDERGFIKTNMDMSTSVKGLYAIGDVRNTPLRQIATAVSDGALCAFAIKNYLKETH